MTVEILIAFVISLAAVVYLMPKWISYLKILSFNQNVSEYSLQEYKEKAKTPIMGGLLFIAAPVVITIVSQLIYGFSAEAVFLILSLAGYGLIGFIDDWLIVVRHDNEGLKPRNKLIMQIVLALIIYLIYRSSVGNLSIRIPFTNASLGFGHLYAVIILLMFAGSSNAEIGRAHV